MLKPISQVEAWDRELYTRCYICRHLLGDISIEKLEELLGAEVETIDTYKAPDIITLELSNGKQYDVIVRRKRDV